MSRENALIASSLSEGDFEDTLVLVRKQLGISTVTFASLILACKFGVSDPETIESYIRRVESTFHSGRSNSFVRHCSKDTLTLAFFHWTCDLLQVRNSIVIVWPGRSRTKVIAYTQLTVARNTSAALIDDFDIDEDIFNKLLDDISDSCDGIREELLEKWNLGVKAGGFDNHIRSSSETYYEVEVEPEEEGEAKVLFPSTMSTFSK